MQRDYEPFTKDYSTCILMICVQGWQAVLKYCNTEVSELMSFISKLKNNQNRGSLKVKVMVICWEVGLMFASLNSFLKYEMYAQYKHSIGSADNSLQRLVLYVTKDEEYSPSFQKAGVFRWRRKLFEVQYHWTRGWRTHWLRATVPKSLVQGISYFKAWDVKVWCDGTGRGLYNGWWETKCRLR